MLGLDKDALEKLRDLERRDDLSETHGTIVSSMLEAYADPSWHFFTSAQRNLIGSIHDYYLAPPDRKDRETLAFMDSAADDPNISEYERGRIASILGQRGRVPKRFSPYEAAFLKRLRKDLEERARQQDVRQRLEAALDGGEVRRGAEDFCRSIIAQFDERRRWSPIQMEHAEKILAGNQIGRAHV